ncbi:MAG TPA: M20/M25/M40 family metallo-hydrolase [Gemmatimonadaceae bacterium]|nr:M20/M25/M40 family metallo-hydrolase [Gemmatimonadaceae bacterium]
MTPLSHRSVPRAIALLAASLLASPLALAHPLAAQQAPARVDLSALQDEAVRLTQEYLRINTTDPPGNEDQTMRFFARIFAKEGIPFDSASSAPGRGNIWARIKGGSQPALVLLHHMDVVPADPHYWSTDPFAATVKDGVIYGRGALDTKTLGIVELVAFLELHRAHVPLDRDVIFMATADEEAGGMYGAGWVVKNHPEAFRGVKLLINEGGDGVIEGGRKEFAIEVTQKVPLWLQLTATDEPSHGSTPHVTTSVTRLIRALDRLATHQFPPRVVPAVDAYFKALAPDAPAGWKDAYADMAATVKDHDKLLALQIRDPGLAALTRNTCSITMLTGSNKINVVPPEAKAQIDCRLLPDQDPDAFIRELGAVLDDPSITISRIMGFTPAVSSTETPLYRALERVLRAHAPDAGVAPLVSTGFTDSHFFRDLGIDSYGIFPFLIPFEDESGVHGNDERISIENIRLGTAIMWDVVREVAGKGVATPGAGRSTRGTSLPDWRR